MESIKNSRPALSILMVEDDSVACKMIGSIVAEYFPDVTIITAESGEQGVELFKKHTPEIVITDINMSGMDGLQMACEIKLVKDDTRFIVLTGYSDKINLDKFSAIGINDYIVKPIMLEKLFTALEKCIAEITQPPSHVITAS